MTVSLDATSSIDLVLQLETQEEVLVSGHAPLIDTTSTTTGTNYTSEVITLFRRPATTPTSCGPTPACRPTGATGGPLARADDLRRDLRREPVDHRRRQHDQRLQGGSGEGHQQRVRPGGRGQDRRLPGRIRPGARRRHQRHHEVGRQRRFTATASSTTTRRAPPRRRNSGRETRASPRCAWSTASGSTTASTSAGSSSRTVCGSSAPTTASRSGATCRGCNRRPRLDRGPVPARRDEQPLLRES